LSPESATLNGHLPPQGEKLWVDLPADTISAQRGGGFARMLGRQGRAVTVAWVTRFHGRVRSFVEKEIVQVLRVLGVGCRV